MDNEAFVMDELHKEFNDAWTALYNHFRDRLLWYCIRLTDNDPISEEIVNDCIEKACKRKEQFSNVEHVRKFLFHAAKNACIDQFRKTGTRRQVQQALLAGTTEPEGDAFARAELERRELLLALLAAIEQLPPQQKEAFRLIFIEEAGYEKAVDILGIGRQNMYNLVTKAKKNLRAQLGDLRFLDE